MTGLAQAVGVSAAEREFMLRGACLGIDPDLFFPEDLKGVNDAKQVCRGCAVRRECLEYALKHNEPGMWGGESERERERILDARKAQRLIDEHRPTIVDRLAESRPA